MNDNCIRHLLASFHDAVIGKPRWGMQNLYEQEVENGCAPLDHYKSWLLWGLCPVPLFYNFTLLMQAAEAEGLPIPVIYCMTEPLPGILAAKEMTYSDMMHDLDHAGRTGISPTFAQPEHYLLCLPDQTPSAISEYLSREGAVRVPILAGIPFPCTAAENKVAPGCIIA
jgi:hypothetical protein